ncbi:MAG: HIT family protein [Bacteroidia bacterium]|nr:HIT family protein [Bacteroidia bacterium]
MASVFTKIINGELSCHKIAENDKFLAFLDVFPLVHGHVLVIPKKETDYIFDMEDAELAEMMVFAKNVAKAQRKAVPCKRIGVAVIGLEVPHAHIHLVPMNAVGDINFTQAKIKPTTEELTAMAENIRSQF